MNLYLTKPLSNPAPPQSGHTFSAKEKDAEIKRSDDSRTPLKNKREREQTGYNYTSTSSVRRFGARYYDSDISLWLSVDQKSDKGPWISPYAYCFNNPIVLTDPDGKWPGITHRIILKKAFSNELASGEMSKSQFNQLVRASRFTDKLQSPADSPKHSMLDGSTNQNVEQAQKVRKKFNDDQSDLFTNDFSDKGYFEEGQKLHSIADEDAPSHNWTSWNGLGSVKDVLSGIKHKAKEITFFGLLHKNEINKSAEKVRNNYQVDNQKRNENATQQANDRVNNGSGMGGIEQSIQNENKLEY